jgi:integrase
MVSRRQRSPSEALKCAMPTNLTDTAIAKAARVAAETDQRRDLSDAGCPGLRLRLTPAGSKTWALACRDRHGRMRRFPLGGFPEMGLSEARAEARRLHTAVKTGADPIADRRRDRAIGRDAKAGIGTLAAVLDNYEAHKGCTLKSWEHSRKRVDRVFAPMMPRAVATLAVTDLQMTADCYLARQSAAFAVRTIRPALKWAAQRGYVPAALAMLQAPATVQARKRVLSRDELAALLPVLRASDRQHAAVIRFLLLTLARLNEATGARWRDIDLNAGSWAIPETKNGQPHVVPLSRQAAALLTARRPDNPHPEALVFATGNGMTLGNWDRAGKALQAESGTAGWTRHDLRRTGATMLGDMGELPDIIEAALNHVSIHSPLAGTYNRSRYRPQVAVALQRLADALDGIEAGGGQVVPLHAN